MVDGGHYITAEPTSDLVCDGGLSGFLQVYMDA